MMRTELLASLGVSAVGEGSRSRGGVVVVGNSCSLESKEGMAAVLVACDSTPRGRGNVLVARNSHMRAAGTLPLQPLATND